MSQSELKTRADSKKINFRYNENGTVGVSLDETVTLEDVSDILWVFGCEKTAEEIIKIENIEERSILKSDLRRTSPYLSHPIFNSYHSETRLVRYMKMLENKDVSLVHSMIPLVSEEIFLETFPKEDFLGFLYNEVKFHNGDDAVFL